MVSFRQIVLVGVGGLIGSILRYLLSLYVNTKATGSLFPWGTFTVNIAGSLVIGIMFGYSLRNPVFEMNWRLFLATGICGGFTTFSAFSNESYLLLRQQHYGILFLYIAVSIIVSISATAAGYWVTR